MKTILLLIAAGTGVFATLTWPAQINHRGAPPRAVLAEALGFLDLLELSATVFVLAVGVHSSCVAPLVKGLSRPGAEHQRDRNGPRRSK